MKVSNAGLRSVIAGAFLAAHLPFLAPSLEDIDSINFALGLREFDVARHQPHPPGYPVYIAAGRLTLAAVHVVAPDLAAPRAEALALALWSALAGALAIAAAGALFREFNRAGTSPDRDAAGDRAATWSALVLAMAPLFWISGSRPLSDLPGLAMALLAQALALRAMRTGQSFAWPALVAAVAIGVRIQTGALTVPLLLFAVLLNRRTLGARGLATASGAFAAGCLLWLVPLVLVSGGPARYLAALGSQAGADFAWVDMLWANPTPRRLARSLYETIVLPWGTTWLATIVGLAAAAAAAFAIVRERRPLILAAVAFGPYAFFHLLFQETLTVRYALPLVVPLAWLAVQGVALLRPLRDVAPATLAIAAGVVAIPVGTAYRAEAHPVFRALDDVARTGRDGQAGTLFAHYSMRRPLEAQTPVGVTAVIPPRTSEWVDLLAYWRRGEHAPVWFLADPKRTDLALVDPEARRAVTEYRWRVADRPEFTGTRPLGANLYRLQDPGWFAGEGWSLTPELGGVVQATASGVDHRPIQAFVRRRAGATHAIVGARHLGTAADGAVSFTFAIDGRTIDEWRLDPAAGPNVLRIVRLPVGSLAGEGPYAAATITARGDSSSGATPPVAIRQFDIQSTDTVVTGFDAGWHEEEYENLSGARWRWSSGRSLLRVIGEGGILLRLRGESPLKYFDTPPRVRVVVGDRVVMEERPAADFAWSVAIPAEDLRRAEGIVAVETDPVYLPGKAEGTTDARELGLRLFEIAVNSSGRK